MLLVTISFVFFAIVISANPIDRNLAYRSPFVDHPHLGYDTRYIHARLAKRQVEKAGSFTDEHYPTWYGADFSNSPFIYSGGINFTHGVASGDPFDESVLLWTRAAPVGTSLPDQSVPICVAYSVWQAGDLGGQPVTRGQAFTSYDVDWTVKVEAAGLHADTRYTYQFSDCTNSSSVSIIGTTRTFASPDTVAEDVNGGEPLSFAVFSCSNYPFGFFNAYAFATKNTTADVFVHLGDYSSTSIGRILSDRELATITDYRTRIALYRTDAGLLEAHQNHPWIVVWLVLFFESAGSADSNDTAAGCAYSPSGTCFTDRKLSGIRAYHEWMPIRQVVADDKLRIWRNFEIGQLLVRQLFSSRWGRRQYDRDLTDVYYNTEYVNTVSAYQNRSIMGFEQENWFYDTLNDSKQRKATWRVVGQQIVFTQLDESGAFDLDAWDGYRANRLRVLDFLYNNSIDNTVILSGDSHANWASDLAIPNDTTTYNSLTGRGAIGVEFAGTAVSSPSSFGQGIAPLAADVISQQLVQLNPDLQWSEGSYRGFFTLEVSTHNVTATYYAMRNISSPNTDGFASAKFVVKSGQNKLARPVAGGSVSAGALRNGTHE
ncbi:PhoD-like phosphatase-domain-containing protein [Phellopilus nigrolimitatus]|nr:PhoD-like phosphatase-domain-containing protein [Phellopilus nigrolimitatus]